MTTIVEHFRSAVDRDGDRVLLRHRDEEMTVREADELSDALAAGLADLGVGRGDRVAILLQNQPEYVLTLLASWKLGAIAVLCSPLLRAEELAFELRDSEAETLVCLDSLVAELVDPVRASTPVRTVITSSRLLDIASARAGERPLPADLGPGDVAALTYTSGTTGPPKGAMNTHGNVLHSALVYREVAELDGDDVVLGIAPLFHVTGLVAHVAVALLIPATLVLTHRFDPAEACALIERHGATFTVAAITAYTAMLNAPEAAGRDLSSLRKAYSGGAPVSPAGAQAWEDRTGHVLHTVYGLTETTSPSHMTPLGTRPPIDPGSGALAVGIPVAGTVARIVGADGATLPPYEPGEIAIRGPQVIPGYWRRPEETAHALPDGELRTGDIGLVDDDGWFYVVDRLKDQINASGFKVWPRDVEDVLYAHPAVREVAVVGVPDDYRGETVKAFVSLKGGAAVEPEDLIAFARERLASYKYPRLVEILPELPKTASGKILRRSLRER